MKLPVVTQTDPWYAQGLNFTCTQCGACCTGGPGVVWISKAEVGRLAEFLKLTPEQVVQRYCRLIDGRLSLKETLRGDLYDCVFLQEQSNGRRGCSIYPVRPLQCRTWPFWSGNLTHPKSWQIAATRCPGMNHGRHFDQEQIESLRNAKDWPK